MEEARLKYRHIELTELENGYGIQLELYDDYVSISIPYWHRPKEAKAAFEAIWTCLAAITKETAYLVYDPQIEKALDLSSDQPLVLGMYRGVMVKTEKSILKSGKVPAKPWWRFW